MGIYRECPHCSTEFDTWYHCPKCNIQYSFDYCSGYEAAQDRFEHSLKIGDKVEDEDGNTGWVGIYYNDGDFCTIENDAAHPNPKLITS